MQRLHAQKEIKYDTTALLETKSEAFKLRYRLAKQRDDKAEEIIKYMLDENDGAEFSDQEAGISVIIMLALEQDQASLDFLIQCQKKARCMKL